MQSGANTIGLTAGVAVMTVVACVSLGVIIAMIVVIIWCRYCPQNSMKIPVHVPGIELNVRHKKLSDSE